MQRRSILALLVPCALLSASALFSTSALADPAPAPGAEPAAPPLSDPSVWAATPPAPPEPPPPVEPSATNAQFAMRPPVSSALYLQGFDVSWESQPRSISSLMVVADGGADSVQAPPTGALLVQVQAGPSAEGARADDAAMVNLAYGGVSSENTPIYRGAVRASLQGGATGEPTRLTIPIEVPLQATPAQPPPTGDSLAPTEPRVEPPAEPGPGAPVEPRIEPAPDAATPRDGSTEPPPGTPPTQAARYDSGAVFLHGLAIETDATHPAGFTPHVMAVALGPVTVKDGIARFDLTLEVQGSSMRETVGGAPDERTGAPEPAVPDQAAAGDPAGAPEQAAAADPAPPSDGYGAEVEVGWVLVPAASERVHRLEASGGAAHGIEVTAESTTRTATQAQPVALPLGVDLRPETTDVAVGLSGFRVALDPEVLNADRTFRSLGVTIADASVDPWRHRWDGVVDARFSSVGAVPQAASVALEADVTVLELDAGERAWSGQWSTPTTGDPRQLPYPAPIRTGRR